jgi:hypothetical protein
MAKNLKVQFLIAYLIGIMEQIWREKESMCQCVGV